MASGIFEAGTGSIVENMLKKIETGAIFFANTSMDHSHIQKIVPIKNLPPTDNDKPPFERISNIAFASIVGIILIIPAAILFTAVHIKSGIDRLTNFFKQNAPEKTTAENPYLKVAQEHKKV